MVVKGMDAYGKYLLFSYNYSSLFEKVKEESVIHARLAKDEKGDSLFDEILITDDEKYLFYKYLDVVKNELYNKFLEYNLGVERPIVPLPKITSDLKEQPLVFYLVDRDALKDTIHNFDDLLSKYITVAIANYILNDITKGNINPLFQAQALSTQQAFMSRLFYISLGNIYIEEQYNQYQQNATGTWSNAIRVQEWVDTATDAVGTWSNAIRVQEWIDETITAQGTWGNAIRVQEWIESARTAQGTWGNAIRVQEWTNSNYEALGAWSNAIRVQEWIQEETE